MFERFTGRARQVVVLAQEEARRLRHGHIGTEHILLGALRDPDTVAARALHSMGVSLEDARQQVEDVVGRGEDPSQGHIPFTDRGKKALELSLREALRLQHSHIGDEHILLGVIREGEGTAVGVLENLGVDLADLRERVTELLEGAEVESDSGTTEVGTSVEVEASVDMGSASGDEPRCGRCNAPAADNVRARTVRVPDPGEDSPDSVTLMWCGTCGAVLGSTPGPVA